MEKIQTQNGNNKSLDAASKAEPVTTKELTVDALMHEHEAAIEKLANPELQGEERAKAEAEVARLSELVSVSMRDFEREVDVGEFTTRDELARKHGFDFVSPRYPNGCMFALKMEGEKKREWVITPQGVVMGPYDFIFSTRHNDHVVAILDSQQGVMKRYAVIDTVHDVSKSFEALTVDLFDSETIVVKYSPSMQAGIVKIRDILSSSANPTPEFYDHIEGLNDKAVRLKRKGEEYLKFKDGEVSGPYKMCKSVSILKSPSDGAIDVVLLNGTSMRVWPDGRMTAQAFVDILSQPGHSSCLGVTKGKHDLSLFSIVDQKGVPRGSYVFPPEIMPSGEYMVSTHDMPENLKVPHVTGLAPVYVVNEKNEIVSGPWIEEEKSDCFQSLRKLGGKDDGKTFVYWQNGHLHGPFDDPVTSADIPNSAQFLRVVREKDDGGLSKYVINDAGLHGPYDRVINTNYPGGATGYSMVTDAHTGQIKESQYLIRDGWPPEGPMTEVRKEASQGTFIVRYESKAGLYVLTRGVEYPRGPIPEGCSVFSTVAGDHLILVKKGDGSPKHFVLTKENTLLGLFSTPPEIENDFVIVSVQDGAGERKAYIDFDGYEHFNGKTDKVWRM